jgi:hypothetical protein
MSSPPITQTASDRADGVASVRPAIIEVIAALAEAEDKGTKLCATFELSANQGAWIQFDGEVLNVALSPELNATSDFAVALEPVSPWRLLEEEPGKFATFAIDGSSTRAVAQAVNATLVLLGQNGAYAVDTSLAWLPREA